MSRSRPLPQMVVRPLDAGRGRAFRLVLGLAWVASVLLAWYLGGRQAAPAFGLTRDALEQVQASSAHLDQELDAARDQMSGLERAEQVSRTAAESLQQTLREREDEVASLRADLAFYQRLVGGSAPRQGLTVHEFELRPIADSGGYAFDLTLLQNLKQGAVTKGQATLSVEGVRDGKLATLTWADLRQDPGAGTIPFSFKYFQRLDGSFVLPPGFAPNRVRIVVKSDGGEATERAIEWREALATAEKSDVRQ
jgi:hypothetical protein